MMINVPFSAFVFLTVATTRAFLHSRPTASPTMFGFRLHHWMYGLVIGTAGILFNSSVTIAIGLGLFIDELTFILIRGKNHKDYISRISVLGTIFLVLLAILLSGRIVALILF